MKPIQIRVELLKKRDETNMSKIARSLNPPVSTAAVSRVIDRHFVSDRIMRAVADAIGRDVKYVFPDYYLKKTA